MPPKKKAVAKNRTSAIFGFEQKLWASADKMRGQMDAAEYKHVALGLIFLKYISDAFEERHAELLKEKNAGPEDRDGTPPRTSPGCRKKPRGPSSRQTPPRRTSHGPLRFIPKSASGISLARAR